MAPQWREKLVQRIRVEAQPPEKLSHQPRLYTLTQQIGAGMDYDDDIVFAAAWVHDLGVFSGHRPESPGELAKWDATAYTVAQAPGVLRACGFPEEKIAAAVECIRTHEAHRRPANLEGILLRDADLLEQLGAIAIMRTTAKTGRDTRFSTFADAAASLRRALESVPASLTLAESRILAAQRIASLRQFLDALDQESGGCL